MWGGNMSSVLFSLRRHPLIFVVKTAHLPRERLPARRNGCAHVVAPVVWPSSIPAGSRYDPILSAIAWVAPPVARRLHRDAADQEHRPHYVAMFGHVNWPGRLRTREPTQAGCWGALSLQCASLRRLGRGSEAPVPRRYVLCTMRQPASTITNGDCLTCADTDAILAPHSL